MSPKKGLFQIGNTSSNQWFSGEIRSFSRGESTTRLASSVCWISPLQGFRKKSKIWWHRNTDGRSKQFRGEFFARWKTADIWHRDPLHLRHIQTSRKKIGDSSRVEQTSSLPTKISNGQMYKYHESHVCMQFCSLCLISLISNSELFGKKGDFFLPFQNQESSSQTEFSRIQTLSLWQLIACRVFRWSKTPFAVVSRWLTVAHPTLADQGAGG